MMMESRSRSIVENERIEVVELVGMDKKSGRGNGDSSTPREGSAWMPRCVSKVDRFAFNG